MFFAVHPRLALHDSASYHCQYNCQYRAQNEHGLQEGSGDAGLEEQRSGVLLHTQALLGMVADNDTGVAYEAASILERFSTQASGVHVQVQPLMPSAL